MFCSRIPFILLLSSCLPSGSCVLCFAHENCLYKAKEQLEALSGPEIVVYNDACAAHEKCFGVCRWACAKKAFSPNSHHYYFHRCHEWITWEISECHGKVTKAKEEKSVHLVYVRAFALLPFTSTDSDINFYSLAFLPAFLIVFMTWK